MDARTDSKLDGKIDFKIDFKIALCISLESSEKPSLSSSFSSELEELCEDTAVKPNISFMYCSSGPAPKISIGKYLPVLSLKICSHSSRESNPFLDHNNFPIK